MVVNENACPGEAAPGHRSADSFVRELRSGDSCGVADRQVRPTKGMGCLDDLRDVLRLVSDTAALRGDAVKHFFENDGGK